MIEVALRALNTGDAEGYARLHTDDIVVLAPGRPPQVGKDALRLSAQKLSEQQIRESRSIDEITVSGNWAIVRGSYDVVLTPKEGGPPKHDSGNYIDILCKKDGAWRYARSIWNVYLQ
jgi:uncharacterized protein (TIGR02246 family)